MLAELKAICYLLKVFNRYFAGPLIALCYPQGVYSLIKEYLSLQYMRLNFRPGDSALPENH